MCTFRQHCFETRYLLTRQVNGMVRYHLKATCKCHAFKNKEKRKEKSEDLYS